MPDDAALPGDVGPDEVEYKAWEREAEIREQAVTEALLAAGTRVVDFDHLWCIVTTYGSRVIGPFTSYEQARAHPENTLMTSITRMVRP